MAGLLRVDEVKVEPLASRWRGFGWGRAHPSRVAAG
jgi:hypothetical protein